MKKHIHIDAKAVIYDGEKHIHVYNTLYLPVDAGIYMYMPVSIYRCFL